MSMNVLAIAGNFFLIIEGLEKFQLVAGFTFGSFSVHLARNMC